MMCSLRAGQRAPPATSASQSWQTTKKRRSTPDEFKAEVIEGVSRFAFKAFTKPLRKEHLDGINKLLDTKFTPEDMEYIYTNLGNGINHELCMKFVKSGYDLKVIEESV